MAAEEEDSKLRLVQELTESGHGPSDCHILTRPISAQVALASDIPMIDLHLLSSNKNEADKLKNAVTSLGLFQVLAHFVQACAETGACCGERNHIRLNQREAIGHDLSPSFLDEMRNVSRHFFQLPLEVKEKYSNLKGGKFEFEGYGNDFVANKDQIIDWNDRLYLLVQPKNERKLEYWPETPTSFREILNEYSIQTRKITDKVLLSLAKLLQLDEKYFVNQLGEKAQVFARFNYYPSCSKPDLVFGIKPHSDGSVMTIVLPDKEVDGLQVLKDGEWLKVPIIPNALLINMGNQMEVMSNGILKSPVHRVVANSQERLSLAMFYAIEQEKMLEPAEGLISDTSPCLYRKMITKDFLSLFLEKYSQGSTTIDWLRV